MKIFITGGTGFIGRPVVKNLLSQGHTLALLSRNFQKSHNPHIVTITGDLKDINPWKSKLAEFKPDAAIHLGWEGLPNHTAEISRINLEQSLNITQLLAEIGCKRMVVIGSCWEYGKHKGKITETGEIRPFDSFTAAKHSLHWMGREIAKEKGMEFIWTRLFYVYGPGQHAESLIPHLIESVRAGRIPKIRNPDARNDFIFVEDAAEAIILLTLNPFRDSIYNIGSGKLISVLEIISEIFKKYKLKADFNKTNKEYKDSATDFFADISKIKTDHKWKPKTSMKVGIERTIKSTT